MSSSSPLTEQEQFWKGDFGAEYLRRNTFSPEKLDAFYKELYGVSRTEMNEDFLSSISLKKILEVGCNTGNQMQLLQHQKYPTLFGIEINEEAVSIARENCKSCNIVQGSGFDLPFRDGWFDLVFTSGVLIHIHPDDLGGIMDEMYRCSGKWIWGFEYFSEQPSAITYRGNENRLWKCDFAALFLQRYPGMKLIKKKLYPYLANDNMDQMYLLEK